MHACMHACNAPSPAATASLEIGKHIAGLVTERASGISPISEGQAGQAAPAPGRRSIRPAAGLWFAARLQSEVFRSSHG